MQLLLLLPLLLELLDLALGHLVPVGELGRHSVGIKLLVLGVTLEQVLGRDLGLGPLLRLRLLLGFAGYFSC